jgi:hypothetical protein
MSLKAPQGNHLKRKSEERLRPLGQEEDYRQERAQIEREMTRTRLEKPGRQEHYVEKKVRKRKHPFCCQCNDDCKIEGDEDGGQCNKCEHYRCGECLLGRPKRKGAGMKTVETKQ